MADKSILQGIAILLIAAFFWGVGNTITGITAHDYLSSGSIFAAIDIALANTIGGLFIVAITLVAKSASENSPKTDNSKKSIQLLPYLQNKYALFGGVLKGANTSLFVLSTTYVMATQSVVFESTYIIWSLILGIAFFTRKTKLISTVMKVLLLFVGVILVSGQTTLQFTSGNLIIPGVSFGLFAGLTYAFYLFSWSFVTKDLNSFRSELLSTFLLLAISFLSIVSLSEIVSIILRQTLWIPFTALKPIDVGLQALNGVLVIGIVYSLVTIGMSNLRKARHGAGFIAALCLSCSIPLTLLVEFIIGKFLPTAAQLLGVGLFVVGFILISISLSDTQEKRSKKQ